MISERFTKIDIISGFQYSRVRRQESQGMEPFVVNLSHETRSEGQGASHHIAGQVID